MDPLLDENKEPYAPKRYKEIVKECYLISKIINTSYIDLMKITPLERRYIFEFIIEEQQKHQELIEKLKAERNN